MFYGGTNDTRIFRCPAGGTQPGSPMSSGANLKEAFMVRGREGWADTTDSRFKLL